ncbi:MAG: restriction endonuclease [Chloroflexota bacterium]|nr:restriction endonuclease [Chloroflexota bacterium]
MRQIDLQEYQDSAPHALSVDERHALASRELSLGITPASGEDGKYILRPSSTVGALEVGGLSVLIRPKIGIPKLLSLACYAMGMYRQQDMRLFDFKQNETLPDTLALALVSAARRAFSRGLLHGYQRREESMHTVRGRIRFAEQIRRRFGVPLPAEVRYDEFTDDILENRLVKAAAMRLGTMRLRSPVARRGLGWIAGMLDGVSYAEFAPGDVPSVSFDRLNEHYRGVVGLARLVLMHSAFEAGRGRVRASGFLMDMNKVFQEFVTVALREALGLSERVFREEHIPSLDVGDKVGLRPDLTWWDGGDCVFVGDAKYKNITGERVPNSDLYQLLAYATALGLPGGLLIYAHGEADTAVYEVRHSGKRLEVAAVDLSGGLDEILARIDVLAQRVKALRDEAQGLRRAA